MWSETPAFLDQWLSNLLAKCYKSWLSLSVEVVSDDSSNGESLERHTFSLCAVL